MRYFEKFTFTTENEEQNLKVVKIFEKGIMTVIGLSMIYFIGYGNAILHSDYKLSQLKLESKNSEKLITQLKSSINSHKDDYTKFVAKGTSSIEYKRELIKQKSGIIVSKNLLEKHIDLMLATADYYQIPYRIYFRVGARESDNFSSIKSSPKGAKYYFQIMPGTFKEYTKNFPVSMHTVETNIMVSGLILADMFKYYGNWTKSVAAYNAGQTAVNKVDGVPNYRETIRYTKFVMDNKF